MNFTPTIDQLDLREGAKEFLRGSCTPELLRELREGDDKNPKLWASIAELGLLGFLASEDNGGLGMNAVGFSLIAEEAGYVALPEPFCEIAGVALTTLNALGMAEECAQLAAGTLRVLPVHHLNPYVNQYQDGDKFLVIAAEELRLIDGADCTLTSVDSIDPARQLHKVAVPANAGQLLTTEDQAAALNDLAQLHGAVFTSAELLGLSTAMLDMATAYAQDRNQFGKPIGSYQAVKHHLASALVAVEFARPAVLRAAHAIATCDSSARQYAAHAKVAAGDAATQVAEVAIQVHGGMGYTFEVDLHMWMKRTWALQGLWGDRNHHMKYLERCVFADQIETGPAASFST